MTPSDQPNHYIFTRKSGFVLEIGEKSPEMKMKSDLLVIGHGLGLVDMRPDHSAPGALPFCARKKLKKGWLNMFNRGIV